MKICHEKEIKTRSPEHRGVWNFAYRTRVELTKDWNLIRRRGKLTYQVSPFCRTQARIACLWWCRRLCPWLFGNSFPSASGSCWWFSVIGWYWPRALPPLSGSGWLWSRWRTAACRRLARASRRSREWKAFRYSNRRELLTERAGRIWRLASTSLARPPGSAACKSTGKSMAPGTRLLSATSRRWTFDNNLPANWSTNTWNYRFAVLPSHFVTWQS